MINWIKVVSSNIDSIAYDATEKILFVKFYKGGIYKYFKVSQNIYENFLNSDSKGRHHAGVIKGRIEYEKMDEFFKIHPFYLNLNKRWRNEKFKWI